MNITSILETVQFLVDKEGQHTAVQMDIATWHALQQLLEDLEDMADIVQARQEQEETIGWDAVITEYETLHNLKSDVSN